MCYNVDMSRTGSLMDKELLRERWEMMLVYQEEIKPWIPTMRELIVVWKVASTSVVRNTLINMVKEGMAVSRKSGNSTEYYAYGVKRK